jgi:hypothetical protein
MKSLFAFVFICTSLPSLAGTTCMKGSKTILSCQSSDGTQYDVCKKSNIFLVRINGKIYAAKAESLITDGVLSFQGINYSFNRFILEQKELSKAILTELNKFEMPIGEELVLTCN